MIISLGPPSLQSQKSSESNLEHQLMHNENREQRNKKYILAKQIKHSLSNFNKQQVVNTLISQQQQQQYIPKKYLSSQINYDESKYKNQNIFLEQNNPVNNELYKELNKGPKMKNGKIVPYSLVGSPNWFMRQKEISEKRKIRQKAVTKLGGDYASPLNREEDDKGRNAQKQTNFSKFLENKVASPKKIDSFAIEKSPLFISKNSSNVNFKPRPKKCTSNVENKLSKEQVKLEIEQITKRQNLNIINQNNIINQLPIEQRNTYTRQGRVINSFENQKNIWDQQLKTVTDKVNKNPDNSCMLRGENFRKKMEFQSAFEALKSEEQRFGKRMWYMYLRKYPNMTEENAFLKNDESNLQNMQQEYNIKSKADTKSTRNNFTNQYHTTSNAKENTQSDIFSGFMTYIIDNTDRNIESIRKPQDPEHFHTSQSNGFQQTSSSQFYVQNVVRQNQKKLKNKMVLVGNNIDELILCGKNKLQQEINVLSDSNSQQYQRLFVNENLNNVEKVTKENIKNKVLQFKKNIIVQKTQENIAFDYNIKELSKTGMHFYPNLVNKITTQ